MQVNSCPFLNPSPSFLGYTLVTETDLLRDLLFVFQGIDGAFIQYCPEESLKSSLKKDSFHQSGTFKLRSDIKIPKPTRQMIQKLCTLGWLYRMIKSELDYRITSKYQNGSDGLYGQALVACIEKELIEYKR